MLDNFFRINLPYGMAKNENNEWVAFNREGMPLGYNDTRFRNQPIESYGDFPIYTDFKGLTDTFILELIDNEDERAIQKDSSGAIVKFHLYKDGSNPTNLYEKNETNWDNYFEKLKKLSKLKVK